MEMSRLARDGTAEPVSRDKILRRERGPGNNIFPCSADHDHSRIGNLTRLIPTLSICVTIHRRRTEYRYLRALRRLNAIP